MTPRARLVLLTVAAMAVGPGLLAVDGMVLNRAPSLSTAVVGVVDRPDTLVATPARSQPVLTAIRGVALSMALVAAASLITRGRLRSMKASPIRLVDVGDAWRALLLGAPPILL